MIFPFVLVAMIATPIAAVMLSVRDRQMMAPPAEVLDTAARVRADASLRGAPTPWRTLVPLVRVEAVRLVRHPAPYLVALPLCALSLSQYGSPAVIVYDRNDVDLIIYLVPYAWGTLIASNLLTLRSRRWGSDELLGTTPIPQRSRTVAHLLAPIGLLPGAAVLLAVAFAIGTVSGRAVGTPRPWVVVTGLLLVVGGGGVGVAVARWLPRPVFGWVAVLVTIVLQVNFGQLDPRWRWLHFSMYGNQAINYPNLAADHHAAHAAYLVAGIVFVAAVALARDGVDRNVASIGIAALAVLVLTGVAQTRPPSSTDAAAFAKRLEDPGATQICERPGAFTVCADPAYVDFLVYWREPVEGVLRRVPSGAVAPGLTIRQRPMIDARISLPNEVSELVDPSKAWPDDAEVSVSNQWALPSPDASPDPARFQLSLAFRTASATLGLAPDARWSPTSATSGDWTRIPLAEPQSQRPITGPLSPCLAGDARAVVATWLAGQATPATRQELRRRAGEVVGYEWTDNPITFDAVYTYSEELPSVLPEQGVAINGADVVAATALLDRPDDEVAAVLAAHWNQLGRSAETTVTVVELLGWFGMTRDEARAAVASTAPAPDPDPHPEDLPPEPAVAGPCPRRDS